MKNLFYIALGVMMLAFVSCNEGKNSRSTATATTDSLNKIIAQKDAEINGVMGTLNEIQDGFSQINAAENRVSIVKDGEGVNKREQLRENVKFIAETMKHNRELISKLQSQLQISSLQGSQFKVTIANMMKQLDLKDKQLQQLYAELESKDIHISELDETINNLNTNVNTLSTDNTKKAETINNQDKQLNTAWFVFGTKKELKDQHILTDGKVLQSNFNKNYFTKIDIRNTTEIKLYSKSVKLLTAHPSDSYSLVKDSDGLYILHITNPQIFWSTSKYLVAVVK